MKPWMRFGLALSLVAAIGACSDDPTGPDFDDTFDAEYAFYTAMSLAYSSEDAMEVMHWETPELGLSTAPVFRGTRSMSRVPGPRRIPRPEAGTSVQAYLSVLQGVAPGCTVSGHGADGDPYDPYDGNENGIPDDYLVTYDCVTVDSIGEGVTAKYEERGELRIKERTDLLFGWESSVKQRWAETRSDGINDYVETDEFNESLEVTAQKATYRQWGVAHEQGFDPSELYEEESGGDLTWVFTPADGEEIDLYELYPEGTVTMSGRFYNTDDDAPSLDWHVRTDRPLVFSPGCADYIGQPFIQGRVAALLNGDVRKAVEVTARDCEEGWDFAAYGGEDPEPIPSQGRPGAFSAPRR